MNLTLFDIPAPTQCGQPPDWETLLVVSDSLEDQGQDKLAQSLRWLYTWDHYPHFNYDVWFWYCLPSYAYGSNYGESRYNPGGRKAYYTALTQAWHASILPQGFLPYEQKSYSTFHAALTAFPNHLPSPSYTPPLLPKFQKLYPRTLIPCT